jgi:integrase
MTWYFRFTTPNQREDGKKVRTAHPICAVDACPDPERMRKVVGAGHAALREGRDPLAAVRTMLAEVLRLPETRVAGNSSVQTWDFATFREEFKKDPPAELRPETIDGYYRAISKTQVGESVYLKRLVEITSQDIRNIRDDIRRRGHDRQSGLTLQALRTALDWATESPRSALSGLTEDNNPIIQVISKRRRNKRKPTHEDAVVAAELIKLDKDQNIVVEDPNVISMEDIGRLLILLRQSEKMPLVKRALLSLLIYSVQRRLTVASAIRKALVGFDGRTMAFWVLDGGTTKSGRPHILPFSSIAWRIVGAWSAALPNSSAWLFPGIATPRKPVPDGHVNARTVNEWMYEACNLAGCSHRYNPHAVRKAFGTYLSKKGKSKAERKLILDHAEGRGADVTEVHYNFDPKLGDKEKVMAAWNTFLDECVELALRSSGSEFNEKSEPLPPAAPEAVSTVAPTIAASPIRVPAHQRLSEPPAVRRERPSGALDQTRLERLQAKLDARKQLDETLARSLGKRRLG